MQFIENIDRAILMFAHNNMVSTIMDSFMVTITAVGDSACVWIAIGLILLFSTNYRKYGVMLFAALFLCLLVGVLGLKANVARERPFYFYEGIKLLVDMPSSYSFPSTHAMTSFASAAIIYFINKKIGIAAYILAVLIAFSRLYLYVNYPSDVLAGFIIGSLIALFVIKVSRVELKRLNL